MRIETPKPRVARLQTNLKFVLSTTYLYSPLFFSLYNPFLLSGYRSGVRHLLL